MGYTLAYVNENDIQMKLQKWKWSPDENSEMKITSRWNSKNEVEVQMEIQKWKWGPDESIKIKLRSK